MSNSSKLIVETTNPDQLFRILNAIKEHGNVGHSFTIVIDEDDEREEKFGWDGDGSDRIEEIYITSDRDSKNKIFSLIKSKCKTRSQRLAFNKLVKSFSTTGEISINDLKKWADSKFNKSPQAGEYNCIKLIEFIINNSNPQPKSNLGGVLHLIKIDEHDDRVLLSYSYERNIKEIRYGEDSLLGQLIDGKWTWYVKFLGKVTKKVTSGMDVIEFVNKIVNEMLQK